uniref:Uncharacterized protein n=1 Tax=Phaeomonas parva TaxID=124430 RepID=A0A6U4GRF6_9STRA|mmetsp:Transcript_31485/g.99831  ORF Transcript_31485/g.99831 Transcript_31485/m.99831 type:complete len:237 (+) Transcript_31485:67-777(+)
MRRAWRSFFAGLGLACLGGPAGALGLRFGWGPRRLGQAGATLDKTGLARGVGVLSEGEDFTIGVASKEDIPQLTELLVSNFCNELILLSSDLNRVERMLATLPVGLINNYFDLTARTEVTLGLQSRLTSELPDLSARSCTRSVMLVARDKETQTDVLGAAELRLVQPNGKLPGNFQPRSQPKVTQLDLVSHAAQTKFPEISLSYRRRPPRMAARSRTSATYPCAPRCGAAASRAPS